MLHILNWGDLLLDMFRNLADFLLFQPFSVDSFQSGWIGLGFSQDILSFIGDVSIGEMVIGGGITGLLVFKLIKFFTDLFL